MIPYLMASTFPTSHPLKAVTKNARLFPANDLHVLNLNSVSLLALSFAFAGLLLSDLG